jgi:hypothetical protein
MSRCMLMHIWSVQYGLVISYHFNSFTCYCLTLLIKIDCLRFYYSNYDFQYKDNDANDISLHYVKLIKIKEK